MDLGRRHIASAGVLAVALHGAIAVAVFWTPEQSGAVGAGIGGLDISMGAAGGAPGLAAPVRPEAVVETPSETAETDQTVQPEFAETLEAETEPEAPPETLAALEEPEQPILEAETAEVREPVPTRAEPVPAAVTPETVQTAAVTPEPIETATVAAAPALPEPVPTPVAESALPVPIEPTKIARPQPTPPANAQPEVQPAIETEIQPDIEAAPAEPVALARLDPAVLEIAPEIAHEITRAEEALPPVEAAEPTEAEPADAVPDPDPNAEVMPIPRARPKVVPPAPTRTARKPEPTRAAPKPARAKPEPEPAPVRQAARPAGDAADTSSDTRGQGEAGAAGTADSAGQSDQARAGGDPGAKRDYMSRLAAILARHKRYPRRAQSRRQEGTGHLFFVVEQSGRISRRELRRSSGHSLLDDEILAILSRVGSFPPIPDEVGLARLEIVVPINFDLR
ncbi:MAG: TonB family protein [Pseudomonadota bacterium]